MIKLEIPLEAETLIETATMLTNLATVLNNETVTMLTNLATVLNNETPPPAAFTELPVATATHETSGDERIFTPAPTIAEQQAAITATKLEAEKTTPPGVDLDSSGLPWDGRIHSAGKTKLVKDQTWKKKRVLDPALVLQVENELRQAMAAPAATVENGGLTEEDGHANEQPLTGAAAAEAFAEGYKEPTARPPLADKQAPPASITPAPATTTPPAATTEPLTFPLIMAKVTNAMALGTLTQEMITAAVGELGIASITLLSARPDLIDAANAKLFPNG